MKRSTDRIVAQGHVLQIEAMEMHGAALNEARGGREQAVMEPRRERC